MKHTLKKLSETKVSLSVSVDADELAHAKSHALKKMAPHIKVAGFRPGKVPASIAEKNVDPSQVASETVEHAINLVLNKIFFEEQLRVLDQPAVEVGEFKPYESLEFTATVEILPAITLGDYKHLKAKPDVITVADDEIQQVIERMRVGFAEKQPVERAAADGDEVIMDFVGYDEQGQPVQGASGTEYPLQLGSKSFIPGFEEGIVGHKAGEPFDLPLTFPADYHAEALKGAKITFTTTIKKVLHVVLPKVDDEFAKRAGTFETVKELKADIKREITAQKERAASDKLKDDLLGELAGKSTVPLSDILVQDQMDSIEKDTMQNLMYRGISAEQYMETQGFKDRQDWREKEFKKSAEQRVIAGLVLAELSKVEKIEVTKDELETRFAQMNEQYKDPKVKKKLDTPAARRDLANRVMTEKTIERLLEINSK